MPSTQSYPLCVQAGLLTSPPDGPPSHRFYLTPMNKFNSNDGVFSGACFSLIGNPVRVGDRPAAVTPAPPLIRTGTSDVFVCHCL